MLLSLVAPALAAFVPETPHEEIAAALAEVRGQRITRCELDADDAAWATGAADAPTDVVVYGDAPVTLNSLEQDEGAWKGPARLMVTPKRRRCEVRRIHEVMATVRVIGAPDDDPWVRIDGGAPFEVVVEAVIDDVPRLDVPHVTVTTPEETRMGPARWFENVLIIDWDELPPEQTTDLAFREHLAANRTMYKEFEAAIELVESDEAKALLEARMVEQQEATEWLIEHFYGEGELASAE